MRVLGLIGAFAVLACGQTSSQAFSLNAGATPQQVQEAVNAARVIADISEVSVDTKAGSFTASGTADQIALVNWIVNAIKAPTGAELSYTYPDNTRNGGSEVRVIYLKQLQSQRDLQEVVNLVRTITDIPKIYQIGESHALFLRSDANRIGAAEWLIGKVDQAAGQPGADARYTMQPIDFRNGDGTAVRVVYFPQATTVQALMDSVNAIRVGTQISKIYPCATAHAIAMRGTGEQVSQAESLLANH